MKKYFQIVLVLSVLGLFVAIRQIKGFSSLPISIIGGQSSGNTSQSSAYTGSYKDGMYAGSVQDAYYGNVQVQVTIKGGKITDVTFLQSPNDNRTSQYINSQAMPVLTREAIQTQSANISGVSGASATSPAFIASLTDALNQAK
jgi:uncharacterized protein with FMN-binding domain